MLSTLQRLLLVSAGAIQPDRRSRFLVFVATAQPSQQDPANPVGSIRRKQVRGLLDVGVGHRLALPLRPLLRGRSCLRGRLREFTQLRKPAAAGVAAKDHGRASHCRCSGVGGVGAVMLVMPLAVGEMSDQKNSLGNLIFAAIGASPLIIIAWFVFAPLVSFTGVLAIGSAIGGRYPAGARLGLAVLGIVLIAVGGAGMYARPGGP